MSNAPGETLTDTDLTTPMIGNTSSEDNESAATTSSVDISIETTPEDDTEDKPPSDGSPSTDSSAETSTNEAAESVDDHSNPASNPDSNKETLDDAPTPNGASESSDSTDLRDAPESEASSEAGFSTEITAKRLETLFSIPTTLIEESRLELDPNGIVITSLDPANVAMARVELSAEGFESFTSGTFETGINLNQASDIAGFYDSGNIVTLSIEDVGTLDYDDGTLDFGQGLITPDAVAQLPETPTPDGTTTFTLTTEFLRRAVKAANMVSDHLTLVGTDDSVIVKAQGASDSAEVETNDEELATAPSEQFEVFLSIEYLREIVRGVIGDTVTLEAGTDVPVTFEGDFADGHGRYLFMLAPRINSN